MTTNNSMPIWATLAAPYAEDDAANSFRDVAYEIFIRFTEVAVVRFREDVDRLVNFGDAHQG